MDLGIGQIIGSAFKSQQEIAQMQAHLQMYENSTFGEAQREAVKEQQLNRVEKYQSVLDHQDERIERIEAQLAVAKAKNNPTAALEEKLARAIRFATRIESLVI